VKELKRVLFAILCTLAIYAIIPASTKAEAAAWSDAVKLNSDSAVLETQPFFVSTDNVLYAAWSENNGSNHIIRVKKYDGTSWSYIDGGGINYKMSENAYDPYLVVYNDTLYAAWEEENNEVTGYTPKTIRVKRYDGKDYSGKDIWTSAANNGNADTLSYSAIQYSYDVCLLVHDNSLYAAWTETYNGEAEKLHVKKYIGEGIWEPVADGQSTGLNYYLNGDKNLVASTPSLASYDGKLYIIWSENVTSYVNNLYVKRYNGGTWELVGENISSSNSLPQEPKLFVVNNTLCAAWREYDNNLFTENLRLKKYNGSSWEFADGGKLNGDDIVYINGLEYIVYNDILYLSWMEELNDLTVRNRVIKYDGTKVAFLNSDNSNPSLDMFGFATPAIAMFNKHLYIAKVEGDSLIVRCYPLPRSIITPTKGLAEGEDLSLYEDTLHEASLSLTLIGTTFIDNTLDKNNFTLVNAAQGLSIKSVSYNNETSCSIDLDFDKTDFDSDISDLQVIVNASEVTEGNDITDTNSVPIKANNDPESITLSSEGNIWEGEESGRTIFVHLSGGTFTNTLNKENWIVSNLPAGVTVGSITRMSSNVAAITLFGNSVVDYDTDITDISVTCPAGDYVDSTTDGDLFANEGVVLRAKTTDITVIPGTGGVITINDVTDPDIYTEEFAPGTKIRLIAEPDVSYRFAYWIDDVTSNIVSTNSSYEFFVGTETRLRAVFQKLIDETDRFHVVFKDPTGKILSSQLVANAEELVEPDAPHFMGYEFLGWDKNINRISSNLETTAQYRRLSATYHLTVNNGTISTGDSAGDYKYDTYVTVNADAAPTGMKFDYWTMNGVIVSRSESYSFFTIMDSMNLTAEYVEAAASLPGPNDPLIALLPSVAIDSASAPNSIQFFANRDVVPSDCTLIESGFLLYQSDDSWSGDLTINSPGVIIAKVKNSSTSQFYLKKNNVNADETWYARAYMIYKDANGDIQVVYSSNTVNGKIS
jgi:hypothetical protein